MRNLILVSILLAVPASAEAPKRLEPKVKAPCEAFEIFYQRQPGKLPMRHDAYGRPAKPRYT